MRHFKHYLAISGLTTLISYQAQAAEILMQPTQIPQSIVLNTLQASGREANITFSNSTLPVKLLCYFAASNGQQPKNIKAIFTSKTHDLEYSDGNNILESNEEHASKMLTILPSSNKIGKGQITIAIEDNNPRVKIITIICTMRK
jgi:hypothetical protein